MIEGIYLMGILQGLILGGIVLFKSRFQSKDSVFITLMIIISTLLVLGQFLISIQYHLKWPTIFIFITGLPLLTGPYLFYYLKSKLSKPISSLVFSAHHLPFVLYLTLIIIVIKISFANEMILFIEKSIPNKKEAYENISLIGLLKVIHLLMYTVAASGFLIKYGNRKTKGLKDILIFFIISQMLLWILIFSKNQYVDEVFILLQVGFLYLIGYHSLLKNATFIENRKYQSSSLDSNEVKEIFGRIEARIKIDELYRDPDFSLKKLSQLTGFSEHQISQSINQITGENFSIFINNYRIEKAKELLFSESHNHLKIISIAFEAGFNNKNSFNEHFKRVVGITPSSYKKKQK